MLVRGTPELDEKDRRKGIIFKFISVRETVTSLFEWVVAYTLASRLNPVPDAGHRTTNGTVMEGAVAMELGARYFV